LPLARAAACAVALAAPPAAAGSVGLVVDGVALAAPAASLKELRFRGVVKQRYDFSCGSAALATLLTYHYGRPTSEAAAFQRMWEKGDRARIREAGFSLLDMKLYLDSIGLAADGFKVGLSEIARVGLPVIALIETRGYKHFVVVKGLHDDRVLVGDPALGLTAPPRESFERSWNGVALAIRSDSPAARASFNRNDGWPAAVAAPLGRALSRDSLASFTVLLPGPNDF
jgi:predicted double-glycine peptidase